MERVLTMLDADHRQLLLRVLERGVLFVFDATRMRYWRGRSTAGPSH